MTMKKIIQQVEGEGLEALLGENVLIFAANYIYAGVLAGVNDADIMLTDASIVYETGPWTEAGYQDAQKIPFPWYIRTNSIESYGPGK